MSLHLPQPVPPVPDDTARIARAAFPRGNPYLFLRDRLGPVFDDAGFADLPSARSARVHALAPFTCDAPAVSRGPE